MAVNYACFMLANEDVEPEWRSKCFCRKRNKSFFYLSLRRLREVNNGDWTVLGLFRFVNHALAGSGEAGDAEATPFSHWDVGA